MAGCISSSSKSAQNLVYFSPAKGDWFNLYTLTSQVNVVLGAPHDPQEMLVAVHLMLNQGSYFHGNLSSCLKSLQKYTFKQYGKMLSLSKCSLSNVML